MYKYNDLYLFLFITFQYNTLKSKTYWGANWAGGPIGRPMKLTVKFVESVSEAGKYYDSYGLFLHVRASGAKKWLQRFTFNGCRREIGQVVQK